MTGATWSGKRAAALDAVVLLEELLRNDDAEDRRLISAYLDAKQVLAAAFEALAAERYDDPSILESAKSAVEEEMRRTYAYLPARYLKVRRFGTSHARLLAYLARSAGTDVHGAELRMLTGDQVHTERRARELRDLGFDLDARHTGGSDVYVLKSRDPDPAVGASLLVARNIREDRALTGESRAWLLREVSAGYYGKK